MCISVFADKETKIKGLAAPSTLTMNQTLEAHNHGLLRYTLTHTHTHTYTHTHTHTYIHSHTHTHIHTLTCLLVWVRWGVWGISRKQHFLYAACSQNQLVLNSKSDCPYCFLFSVVPVLGVQWNEAETKMTSCDSSGLIVVWVNFKHGWYEEMINNRNKSHVICGGLSVWSWSNSWVSHKTITLASTMTAIYNIASKN